VAAEAALSGVPMLSFVTHLALVDADGVAARVAELSEEAVEATKAERATVSHDVPLAAQLLVALEAREMFHVPRSTLGFGALVCEDYLQNGTVLVFHVWKIDFFNSSNFELQSNT
jgi:hypothetical protein